MSFLSCRRATFSSTVKDFPIVTWFWHPNAIIVARDWRKVADYHDELFGRFGVADEGKDAVVAVIGVDPVEAAPVAVQFVQRRLVHVTGMID